MMRKKKKREEGIERGREIGREDERERERNAKKDTGARDRRERGEREGRLMSKLTNLIVMSNLYLPNNQTLFLKSINRQRQFHSVPTNKRRDDTFHATLSTSTSTSMYYWGKAIGL